MTRRTTPAMRFHCEGEVVKRYAKQMGFTGGPSDVFSGPGRKAPGELAEALGYADADAVDNAISQARDGIRNGKLSPRTAVENLMTVHGKNASGETARRLARAFEKAIGGDQSLAEAYRDLADEEPTVPDTRQPEPIAASRDESLSPAERERMARDSAAIRFARTHRHAMPEQLRDMPSEIKAVQRMADRLRTGNDFASAAAAYDEALRRYRAGR